MAPFAFVFKLALCFPHWNAEKTDQQVNLLLVFYWHFSGIVVKLRQTHHFLLICHLSSLFQNEHMVLL